MPPDLEAIVLRCLAKNPADRFHDVRSLETALAECDTVKEWTDDEAAEWWQLQTGSEGRTGSNQGDAEAEQGLPHVEGRLVAGATAPARLVLQLAAAALIAAGVTPVPRIRSPHDAAHAPGKP